MGVFNICLKNPPCISLAQHGAENPPKPFSELWQDLEQVWWSSSQLDLGISSLLTVTGTANLLLPNVPIALSNLSEQTPRTSQANTPFFRSITTFTCLYVQIFLDAPQPIFPPRCAPSHWELHSFLLKHFAVSLPSYLTCAKAQLLPQKCDSVCRKDFFLKKQEIHQ